CRVRKEQGMPSTQSGTKSTWDHNEIRRWAEKRGAAPACVRGTGGRKAGHDLNKIRLDFPGYGGERSLEHISWDEWFESFDRNNLALLYQEKTARGEPSSFNKLVSRDTVEEASDGGRSSGGSSRGSGSGSRKRSSTSRAGARTETVDEDQETVDGEDRHAGAA